MKISPFRMAIFYFLLGILFTYLAIDSVDGSSWNVITFIFAGFATLDFGVGIRALRIHFQLKNNNKR
ncbi:MAG TPA: YdiK family protein [Virgibacillus sp.]|nr:YdiK family protein [Virgibacillus sp.]